MQTAQNSRGLLSCTIIVDAAVQPFWVESQHPAQLRTLEYDTARLLLEVFFYTVHKQKNLQIGTSCRRAHHALKSDSQECHCQQLSGSCLQQAQPCAMSHSQQNISLVSVLPTKDLQQLVFQFKRRDSVHQQGPAPLPSYKTGNNCKKATDLGGVDDAGGHEVLVDVCGCVVANVGVQVLQHLLLHHASVDSRVVRDQPQRVAQRPPHDLRTHLRASCAGTCQQGYYECYGLLLTS